MLTTGTVMQGDVPDERYYPPLAFVNWCARISHRAEDAEKQDVERFLRSVVLDHGDWSVMEHVCISVDAIVDRGITHEIVRHRIASYTQESTRFVNYAKKMPPSFIYPVVGVECSRCLENRPLNPPPKFNWEHVNENGGELVPCEYDHDWLEAIATVESKYKALLAKGWRPQEARSVFPNALASRIVITQNLRQWRHFFLMRTSIEAHPQMRQVTIPLLADFKAAIPVIYEDIEPNAKQSENLKKGR